MRLCVMRRFAMTLIIFKENKLLKQTTGSTASVTHFKVTRRKKVRRMKSFIKIILLYCDLSTVNGKIYR